VKRLFIDDLKDFLGKLYLPPLGQGGHDLNHVLRMEAMYEELSTLISGVDQEEYAVAVWLHNIDRCPAFGNPVKSEGLEAVLKGLLNPAELSAEVAERIVNSVLEHGKKNDGVDDPSLLQMLRLADEWDRIGVHGATSGFAWKGCVMPSYNHQNPFGYGDTSENGWKTHYQNFYRILEWYSDFPLIRDLVHRHRWRFEAFLAFIRAFAREISEAHNVPNTVEADIKRCLGSYYDSRK